MSEQETKEKIKPQEERRPDFFVQMDSPDPSQCHRIIIEINIDPLVSNQWGTAMIRGKLDEFKEELLYVISLRRKSMNKLITSLKVVH